MTFIETTPGLIVLIIVTILWMLAVFLIARAIIEEGMRIIMKDMEEE